MQCTEPWAGIGGTTLENIVANYLETLHIELKGFKNMTPINVVECNACEICAGPTVVIEVDKKYTDRLRKEGFSLVVD